MELFIGNLLNVLSKINNLKITLIDPQMVFSKFKSIFTQYINEDFDDNIEKINKDLESENKNGRTLLIIYGVEKTASKLSNQDILEEISDKIKKSENANLILVDAARKLKALDYETWYSSITTNSDGIWIGKGMDDQSVFSISAITKEMSKKYGNNFGWCIKDQEAELIKLLDFDEKGDLKNEE